MQAICLFALVSTSLAGDLKNSKTKEKRGLSHHAELEAPYPPAIEHHELHAAPLAVEHHAPAFPIHHEAHAAPLAAVEHHEVHAAPIAHSHEFAGSAGFGGYGYGGGDFGGSHFGAGDFGGSHFCGSHFGGSHFGAGDFGGFNSGEYAPIAHAAPAAHAVAIHHAPAASVHQTFERHHFVRKKIYFLLIEF